MSDKNNRLSETVAVVRSYNNKGVLDQVNNLIKFIPHVIVVVDEAKDNGVTKNAFLNFKYQEKVTVLYMQTGYTWSNALNKALEKIDVLNSVGIDYRINYMFNVSVEAGFERSHLIQMLESFDDETVVVGTTFEGYQEGRVVSLGRSYDKPRNTGMVVNLSCFNEGDLWIRWFDTFCDNIEGMEDFDFCIRAWIFKRLRTKILDLKVPLTVGVHYNQISKERNSQKAIQLIEARFLFWADGIK